MIDIVLEQVEVSLRALPPHRESVPTFSRDRDSQTFKKPSRNDFTLVACTPDLIRACSTVEQSLRRNEKHPYPGTKHVSSSGSISSTSSPPVGSISD